MATTFGYVAWRAERVADDTTADTDALPDTKPITGGRVLFRPLVEQTVDEATTPATTIRHEVLSATLDASGVMVDANGASPVPLPVGQYDVTFGVPGALIEGYRIEVLAGHTSAAPLQLAVAAPPRPVPPPLVPYPPVQGRAYRTVACAIRRTAGGTFQVISDSGHVPVGVLGVREVNGDIVIDYDFQATRVVSFVVTPDETFALSGLTVGASVGLASATIRVGQTATWSDYILYDSATAGLKSFNGLAESIGPSSNASLAAAGWYQYLFNSAVSFTSPFFGGQLTSRTKTMDVLLEGAGPSVGGAFGGFNFRFVDAATRADITSPTLADVKVWASFNSPVTRKVPLTELVTAGSNFWIYGVLEVLA